MFFVRICYRRERSDFSLQGRGQNCILLLFFQQSTFSSLSQQETQQTTSSAAAARNENDVGPVRSSRAEGDSAFRESNSKVIRDLWNSAKVGFGKSQAGAVSLRPSLLPFTVKVAASLFVLQLWQHSKLTVVNRKRNLLSSPNFIVR